jgi:hypothetical protein
MSEEVKEENQKEETNEEFTKENQKEMKVELDEILNHISEEEKYDLKNLQKMLEKSFPEDVKDHNIIYKFLRAKKFNLVEAEKQFTEYKKWVDQTKPHEYHHDDEDIQDEIKLAKAFIYGKDKKKRPILIIKAGRHFPSKENFSKTLKLLLLLCEEMRRQLPPPPNDQFLAFYDREDFSRANFDLEFIKAFGLIGNHYPGKNKIINFKEFLGRAFVLHSNFLFTLLWKVSSIFLDSTTASKIGISDFNEVQEYIDKDNLLPEYTEEEGRSFNKKLIYPPQTPYFESKFTKKKKE